MRIRQSIVAGDTVATVSSQALVDVEKLRNTVDSEIDNSRAFFLLGSKSFLDGRKKDRETFAESLTRFEKQYSLPQIPEIVKRMESLDQEHQDIFDQGMKFREKNTESKIVGQFYQSKMKPVREGFNQALDEIAGLEAAAVSQAGAHARDAAHEAERRIPKGMTWLTLSIGLLFSGLALLIIRMMKERESQLSERNRLYEETKKAVQARDEVIFSVSQELKEPLTEISRIIENSTGELVEQVKNQVVTMNGLISDISDQAKAGTETMILRLNQLGINEVLEDARHLLQPLAKQFDVRLQIDSTNPPVLAFFDRERVVRVLSNLVGNAIKFGPKHNRVTVKVRSDQQSVYVSVEDTGGWMPTDQDSGIGYAVAKTIVEAHGGTLSFHSQPDGESVATFSLPRRRPVGAILVKPTMTIKHVPRSGAHIET